MFALLKAVKHAGRACNEPELQSGQVIFSSNGTKWILNGDIASNEKGGFIFRENGLWVIGPYTTDLIRLAIEYY